MALLKEDGSLDIERIEKLPFEEHLREIKSLTIEQKREYYSKQEQIVVESQMYPQEPIQGIQVEYDIEDELNNGCALYSKGFINNLIRKNRNS